MADGLTAKVEIEVEELIHHRSESNPGFYRVRMLIPSTGEIREIERQSVESAFRSLGAGLDHDIQNLKSAMS